MNKIGGGTGLVSGLVGLIGGIVFIWLLITLFSSGAIIGLAGNKALIMLLIFLVVLWILAKKK